ncbi:MAG: elongation factor P maturation arginine rhamnosyltransferase EarP [Aquabacterium sp.]|nr:elongation factor P maturation arginine rhamnosyltransferase EarP [Aquabacterium sp.]
MRAWRWDLFCRVIDNFGDVGVCWRLAAELGARGHAVRLWIDDASALAWMAPQGAPGVTVQPWGDQPPDLPPGDVVVEAFGCTPPPGFVARMAAATPPPVWINLEYLSAEPYAERSHGLRSPQFAGPGAGLDKWFFYPGFTPATGGLLQDGAAVGDDPAGARGWLRAQPWAEGWRESDRLVLLFGYASLPLPGLLQALAGPPTTLLLPPGGLCDRLQAEPLPAGLRLAALPHVSQPEFDRMLAATDLNLVRGEDSFVRAQLCATAPFLWQIYPQDDGAHALKLEAFLDRYLAGSPPALVGAVRQCFHAANGLAPWPSALPEPAAWRALHQAWRARLRAQDDLCTQLLRFVKGRPG